MPTTSKQRTEIQASVDNYRQMQRSHAADRAGAETGAWRGLADAADRVRAFSTGERRSSTSARQIYLDLASQGATPSVIEDGLKSLQGQLKYALNPDYNPRTIVGDNYADPSEHRYGNSDVMGQDAKHGTHVAGIIGAVRGNGVGIDGIAPAVKFMMIRTVPDGDERDKDVANAIRYAVDNGAQIISMSFGKAYSPYKAAVDEAAKYADAHGVLMVHAAGNDGEDSEQEPELPDAGLSRRRKAAALDRSRRVVVEGRRQPRGAASRTTAQQQVDVFAPGVDILSTRAGQSVRARQRHEHGGAGRERARRADHGLLPEPDRADVRRIIIASASTAIRIRRCASRAPTGTEGSVRLALGHRRNRERVQRAQDGRRDEQRENAAIDAANARCAGLAPTTERAPRAAQNPAQPSWPERRGLVCDATTADRRHAEVVVRELTQANARRTARGEFTLARHRRRARTRSGSDGRVEYRERGGMDWVMVAHVFLVCDRVCGRALGCAPWHTAISMYSTLPNSWRIGIDRLIDRSAAPIAAAPTKCGIPFDRSRPKHQ